MRLWWESLSEVGEHRDEEDRGDLGREEMAAATDTADCKEHRQDGTTAREDTSSAHPTLWPG